MSFYFSCCGMWKPLLMETFSCADTKQYSTVQNRIFLACFFTRKSSPKCSQAYFCDTGYKHFYIYRICLLLKSTADTHIYRSTSTGHGLLRL